jgi:hypothetical protein
MMRAVCGIENSVQQAGRAAGPSRADTSFADEMGLAASTTATTPAAAPGRAADMATSLQQFGSDLQRLLLALRSLEASGGTSAGTATTASTASAAPSQAAAAVGTAGIRRDTAAASSFSAQVVSSDAGYDSSYGYYVTDSNGNPVSGQILFANVKDGGSATVSGVDPSHVGFFIIPNGAGDNSGLTNGEAVTFKQVDGQWEAVDASNQVVGGSGANVLFDNKALNGDGIAHAEDNVGVGGNQNWEDTYGGGDRDFNDVNVNLTWNGAQPAAAGSGGNLTVSGENDTVIANDSTITLAAGTTATIVGSGDTIVYAGGSS